MCAVPELTPEEDDAVLGGRDYLEEGIPPGSLNPGNVEPPINRRAPPPPTGACNGDGGALLLPARMTCILHIVHISQGLRCVEWARRIYSMVQPA